MQAEKKDNLIATASTVTIHAGLLLILFFSLLRTPTPPMGAGSGVVLNLGYVDEGSGEVQTLNDANDSPLNQEAAPQEVTQEEQNTLDQNQQDPQTPEENMLAADEETGVEAKKNETKEEAKTEAKESKTSEQKEASTKTTEKSNAVSGKTGTETTGGNNNGDKQGKVGDQGNPQGELNAKALYGNPGTGGAGAGGSGGSSLDMAGWKMDFKIRTDESSENGRLRFKIVVDEEGEVVKIETLEKTVSTEVENYYKRQIENGSFVKDKNAAKTAKNSTGFLTIIIRSK
jgi:periplasmic protein TonB